MNMNMGVPALQDDILGWIIVIIGTIATIYTIVAVIYWIIRPGETDPSHPKRIIMKDDR